MIEIIRKKTIAVISREKRAADVCALYKEIRDTYNRVKCPDTVAFNTIAEKLGLSQSAIRLILVKQGLLGYKKPGYKVINERWVSEEI